MTDVVLFSGGLDSTTCLAMAINHSGAENVLALSLYYGQAHDKELECAKAIAKHYGVEWRKYNVAEIFKESSCSLLAANDAEIPATDYAEQVKETNGKPVSTYVPYRNGLFISIAASIAVSIGCNRIWYGAHRDDAAGEAYPDCSEVFNRAIAHAVWEGSGKQCCVYAPFIDKTKDYIVRIGTNLNVPYELTWSCYNGGEYPCGVCGTCRDRIKAFEKNGLKDPLKYKN